MMLWLTHSSLSRLSSITVPNLRTQPDSSKNSSTISRSSSTSHSIIASRLPTAGSRPWNQVWRNLLRYVSSVLRPFTLTDELIWRLLRMYLSSLWLSRSRVKTWTTQISKWVMRILKLSTWHISWKIACSRQQERVRSALHSSIFRIAVRQVFGRVNKLFTRVLLSLESSWRICLGSARVTRLLFTY